MQLQSGYSEKYWHIVLFTNTDKCIPGIFVRNVTLSHDYVNVYFLTSRHLHDSLGNQICKFDKYAIRNMLFICQDYLRSSRSLSFDYARRLVVSTVWLICQLAILLLQQ